MSQMRNQWGVKEESMRSQYELDKVYQSWNKVYQSVDKVYQSVDKMYQSLKKVYHNQLKLTTIINHSQPRCQPLSTFDVTM